MPNNDYTTKILEMEDAIIKDIETTETEIHIYFSLKRRPHKCPHCGAITDKVHDYRTSIIKDLQIMGKNTFLHYKKEDIIVIAAINIFMRRLILSRKKVVSQLD